MLTELRITNFAVIEQLSLQFQEGFTVLTGETGAGKSILIDALALLVGGRASTEQIRTGADEAQLEAFFSLRDLPILRNQLRADGILNPKDDDLIIRRVLSRSGRHRVYLNGNLSPLHQIEALGGTLVDIHGQHDQQSLLSVGQQLNALDAFGGLKDLRQQHQEVFGQWKEHQRQLEDLRRLSADRAQREEFLRFQYLEIAEADLHPAEEDRLHAEQRRLAQGQRLGELAEQAYELLYAGDQGILGGLATVGKAVSELGTIDPEKQEWRRQIEEAVIQLKELAHNLRDYQQQLEPDPDRLAHVERRLDLVQRLKKKYGGSVESVLAFGVDAKHQLDALESAETEVAALQKQVDEDWKGVKALADHLSRKRNQAATRMQGEILAELAALRMERTRFEISFSAEEDARTISPSGQDRVEFLLSANPGEPLKSLARVASGGELSRIMLAIKTVLAEMDRVPVLIFDEVDAGVGGAVAAVMGQRLLELGRYHQVFCITHLPQVASHGSHHLLVQKSVKQSRTVASVRTLDGTEREEEIARMLGGVTVTKKVRETAAEMIGTAKGKR